MSQGGFCMKRNKSEESMFGLHNHYNLKPCKIVLHRIKEPKEENVVPYVKKEIIEDVCEEKWHLKNDLQKPCKINFPQIKEEIDEEFKWDVNHPDVVASSPNSVSSADGEISPAEFMKMEILEEDVLQEDEMPISEHYNFDEDYKYNAVCTSDPLATESVNSAERYENSLQTAITSSYTSELKKETPLEDEGSKKYLFFCSHCPVWSTDEKRMKLHLLSHDVQGSGSEYSLPAAIKQPSYSTVGMCDQADRNMYLCSICTAKFSEKESMEAHICSHINEELLSDSNFPAKSNQKDSMKIDIRNLMYSCSLCPLVFSQESILDAHSLIHKKESCLSKESPGKLQLRRKVSSISNKVISCSLCRGKLPHKRKVGRPSKNAPQICPGEFSRKQKILKPFKNALLRLPGELSQKQKMGRPHTNARKELYSCSLCSARFPQEKYLTKHMLEHSNEENKLLTCSVCPAKFSLRTHLARHVLSHSGEKPFACSMCPAKFTLKSYLTVHSLSHSGEKPFQCPKCPAKFSLKWYLKKHMIVHTVVSQKLSLKARILNQMI